MNFQSRPSDAYTFLGLPYGSSKEEIKSAYKKLALSLHPDKYLINAQAFNEYKVQIKEKFKDDPEVTSYLQKIEEDAKVKAQEAKDSGSKEAGEQDPLKHEFKGYFQILGSAFNYLDKLPSLPGVNNRGNVLVRKNHNPIYEEGKIFTDEVQIKINGMDLTLEAFKHPKMVIKVYENYVPVEILKKLVKVLEENEIKFEFSAYDVLELLHNPTEPLNLDLSKVSLTAEERDGVLKALQSCGCFANIKQDELVIKPKTFRIEHSELNDQEYTELLGSLIQSRVMYKVEGQKIEIYHDPKVPFELIPYYAWGREEKPVFYQAFVKAGLKMVYNSGVASFTVVGKTEMLDLAEGNEAKIQHEELNINDLAKPATKIYYTRSKDGSHMLTDNRQKVLLNEHIEGEKCLYFRIAEGGDSTKLYRIDNKGVFVKNSAEEDFHKLECDNNGILEIAASRVKLGSSGRILKSYNNPSLEGSMFEAKTYFSVEGKDGKLYLTKRLNDRNNNQAEEEYKFTDGNNGFVVREKDKRKVYYLLEDKLMSGDLNEAGELENVNEVKEKKAVIHTEWNHETLLKSPMEYVEEQVVVRSGKIEWKDGQEPKNQEANQDINARKPSKNSKTFIRYYEKDGNFFVDFTYRDEIKTFGLGDKNNRGSINISRNTGISLVLKVNAYNNIEICDENDNRGVYQWLRIGDHQEFSGYGVTFEEIHDNVTRGNAREAADVAAEKEAAAEAKAAAPVQPTQQAIPAAQQPIQPPQPPAPQQQSSASTDTIPARNGIDKLVDMILPPLERSDENKSFVGRIRASKDNVEPIRTALKGAFGELGNANEINNGSDENLQNCANAVIRALAEIEVKQGEKKGATFILNEGTKDIASFFKSIANLVQSLWESIKTVSREPLQNWYNNKPQAIVWDKDKFNEFVDDVANGTNKAIDPLKQAEAKQKLTDAVGTALNPQQKNSI